MDNAPKERPELAQPAGATVALHEHSEVHAAK